MSTTVETPWGPFRNFGSSGGYVLDPRSLKVRHFNTPGYGNPWCYVFNDWGQGFCGDGTGANQHWDTPLSAAQLRRPQGAEPGLPDRGHAAGRRQRVPGQPPVPRRRAGAVHLCLRDQHERHAALDFSNDGGGYKGTRVRHDPNDPKTAFDLIKSTDKHFRPVDPQIGPDGALWFGDWANPLIGHMQYSQRDPNRDHTNGRIYRLVYKDKPLLTPVTQFGKSEAEVLDQLRAYEWRTRYDARARTPRPARGRRPARRQGLGRAARPGRPATSTGSAARPSGSSRGFHAVDSAAAQAGARRQDARRPRRRRAGRWPSERGAAFRRRSTC